MVFKKYTVENEVTLGVGLKSFFYYLHTYVSFLCFVVKEFFFK